MAEKTIKHTKLFFKVLDSVIDSYLAIYKMAAEHAEEVAAIKDFKNNLQGPMSNATVRAYKTNGAGYKKMVRTLRSHQIPTVLSENNNYTPKYIPCVAFGNDVDEQHLILVPMQYAEEADKIVKDLNDKHMREELTVAAFAEKYMGAKVYCQDGLTVEQVAVIRAGLKGKGIQYCLRENTDGTYMFRCPENERAGVAAVAAAAIAKTNSFEGAKISAYLKIKENTLKRAEMLSADDNRTFYIADVRKNASVNLIYRIDENGINIINKEKTTLMTPRTSDAFEAQLHLILDDMSTPLLKEADTVHLNEKGSQEDLFNSIYSDKELKDYLKAVSVKSTEMKLYQAAQKNVILLIAEQVKADGGHTPDVVRNLIDRAPTADKIFPASPDCNMLNDKEKTLMAEFIRKSYREFAEGNKEGMVITRNDLSLAHQGLQPTLEDDGRDTRDIISGLRFDDKDDKASTIPDDFFIVDSDKD